MNFFSHPSGWEVFLVKKGTTSCGKALIRNYADEWVTVIVDLADKFGNENYLKYVRIDCLEGGKDRTMTLKSVEAYG